MSTLAGGAGPVLRMEGVDFAYGRLQVLFGVSLEVHPGEALALLGTNGAGKSTLLRVVSGLERPTCGTVVFDGHEVTGRDAEEMVAEGLVLISGGRAVFGDLTVAENLEMEAFTLRRRRHLVRQRTAEVLELFPRLAERRSQRADTMSGGEQQQLALAKALILTPRVLCIDELSLGLAPVVVESMIEVVQAIRLTGVSMILVEQSLNVAAALCERAAFMEKGEVRFEGPTSDLLERDDLARAVFLGDDRPADEAALQRRPTRKAGPSGRTRRAAPRSAAAAASLDG